MSDEIAEFLRRAALRRAEQAEAQRRAQQQLAPQPQYQPAPTPRLTPVVVEAEVIEDDEEPVPLRPALSKVSQHVAQHMDTRSFAQRADRMADLTEQADERMESHLHKAFDHKMGSISAGTQSIMAAVTPDTDDEMKGRAVLKHPILSMLSQPQSVRNAIVLSELLQRPEGNW